jgi:hypothetical protein
LREKITRKLQNLPKFLKFAGTDSSRADPNYFLGFVALSTVIISPHGSPPLVARGRRIDGVKFSATIGF